MGPPLPQVPREPSNDWPLFARVQARTLPISHSLDAPAYHIGALRLGALVRVRGPVSDAPGDHCADAWLALEPHGVLCPEGRVALDATPPPVGAVLPPPDPEAVIPHRYVKATDRGAFRYDSPPDAKALAAVLAGDVDARRDYGARPLDGAYFLAIEKTVERPGQRWLKTHEGNYVRSAVTEPITPPALIGDELDAGELPLAFVIEPGTPARSPAGKVVGHAERYARVPLAGDGRPDDDDMVRTADGYLLPADGLRIVRRHPRPAGIPDDARWLQVDVTHQTLLVYDGDEPVYASLVSSGKPGRDTPPGLHRVAYKHRTITMRGADQTGPYEVQEVPWVLYYDGPYAIHGAYWHDTFGHTRSHGCTNLAPADARRVFRFMRPELPAGWHSSSEPGSYVHVTRGS